VCSTATRRQPAPLSLDETKLGTSSRSPTSAWTFDKQPAKLLRNAPMNSDVVMHALSMEGVQHDMACAFWCIMRIQCAFCVLPPCRAIAAPSGPPSDPNVLQIDQLTLLTSKGRRSLLALPTSGQNKAN